MVFHGTAPTHFGFAAGNNMSATLTQYYDNFSLVIADAGPKSCNSGTDTFYLLDCVTDAASRVSRIVHDVVARRDGQNLRSK